jgi:hypothetical protein
VVLLLVSLVEVVVLISLVVELEEELEVLGVMLELVVASDELVVVI